MNTSVLLIICNILFCLRLLVVTHICIRMFFVPSQQRLSSAKLAALMTDHQQLQKVPILEFISVLLFFLFFFLP